MKKTSPGFKAAIARLFNINVDEVSMVGGPAIGAHFTEVKAEGKNSEEEAMNEAQIKAMLDAALGPINTLITDLGTKIEAANNGLKAIQADVTAGKDAGTKSAELGTKLTELGDQVKQLIADAGERFDVIEGALSKGTSARLVVEEAGGEKGGEKGGAKGAKWGSFTKALGAPAEAAAE